jgi:hypothetical protein
LFAVPKFGEVYADGARRAGRINAASISDTEHQDLLRERQALLSKQFDGTITKSERNRLTYVRWSLDRIEDAKYGEHLDRLDAVVSGYEQLLSAITNLDTRLSAQVKPNKGKK